MIRKMMAKRPEDRYQSAQEVADALKTALDHGVGQRASGHGFAPAVENEYDVVTVGTASVLKTNEYGMLTERARRKAVLQGHSQLVSALAFSNDGKWLASIGLDETVRIWNLGGERPGLHLTLEGPQLDSMGVPAFTPDRNALVMGSSKPDGRMVRWGLVEPAGRNCSVFQGDQSTVDALAFSPDGGLMASANGPNVWLWTIRGGAIRNRTVLKGHRASVKALAFAPDGRNVASSGDDRIIRLWQIGRIWCSERNILVGHESSITAMAYSPDGRTLATGGLDFVVRLWDATGNDADERAVLRKIDGVVRQILFFEEGKKLLAASDRGQVILWDLTTNAKVREWQLETTMNYSIALASNGLLATGASSDGKIILYALDLPGTFGSGILKTGLPEHVPSTASGSTSASVSRSQTGLPTKVDPARTAPQVKSADPLTESQAASADATADTIWKSLPGAAPQEAEPPAEPPSAALTRPLPDPPRRGDS
jgi:WD40 repeat protein